jgi:hypothetical protein
VNSTTLGATKLLSKSAHLSQFETLAPHARVVLLGASNLSLMFPTVVESVRAMTSAPLEMLIAKGFGRSYGHEAKFFGKKFLGILQCGLWDAMDRAPRAPTFAVVADVGNDLAYETPVRTIVRWINETLDRLEAHEARVVLNNIPIATLNTVGAVRYHAFRELFFPNCKLPRREMLQRAAELSEALAQLAAERKTPVFSGENAWYGLDPIHPRRRSAGEIWSRMLGELFTPGCPAPLVRPKSATALALRRLRAECWTHFGIALRCAQPAARLTDGTTIALY